MGKRKPDRLDFGIAIFHAAGDILNCTGILRQLKADHPTCRITWFTSERYRFALDHNPLIDELVTLEGDPVALDQRIDELKGSRPWTRFFDPAPYRNYDKLPDGALLDLVRAAAGVRWTVPSMPVVRLTVAEVAAARAYWQSLPEGPRILVETEFHSSQSPWKARSAFQMADALAGLDPCYVFTARNRPSYLDAFLARHPKAVWCAEPFRGNAELYNLCDAFIGVSSGISVLSLADWCRQDVLGIEFSRGEHWSCAPSGVHQNRFLEALETLRLRLAGEPCRPDFATGLAPLATLPGGRELIPCPSCVLSACRPVRGEDVVE